MADVITILIICILQFYRRNLIETFIVKIKD